MTIKNGDTVSVLYTGTYDNGEVFDSSEIHNNEPLVFEVGAHQVIVGFENAVIDKEVGDEVTIRLEPKDAYGERDEKSIQKISRNEMGLDVEPRVGMQLMFQNQHGDHTHQIPGLITVVSDTEVTIDMNHPMAGKTLNFTLKIESVK
jgi:FKBP-type peptidyl-prolyl cis-trans isomerase 2